MGDYGGLMAKLLTLFIVPVTLIALSIPMILQKVPRNHWYGFRTSYTLSSDEVWYHANRDSGVALLVAGLVWLVAALVLPQVMDSVESARRIVFPLGLGSLGAALAISFWLVYR
jgi:formate hydrogenlyase subunit 3/multisubunit Na+/H+ antiporter MnhD subunit